MGRDGKGKAWERKFVNALKDEGVIARRMPLSGALRTHGEQYKDDVIVDVRSSELRLEVKYRRKGEGFKRVIDWFDAGLKQGCLALRLPRYIVVSHILFADYINRCNNGEDKLDFDEVDVHDCSDKSERKVMETWRDGSAALVLCRAYDPRFYVAVPLFDVGDDEDPERSRLYLWARDLAGLSVF